MVGRLDGWLGDDDWCAKRGPFNLSVELTALAVAHWFASGRRQAELFRRAHEQLVLSLDELTPAKRSKATLVYRVATLAIAAERGICRRGARS